jgi:hypothetical protein
VEKPTVLLIAELEEVPITPLDELLIAKLEELD